MDVLSPSWFEQVLEMEDQDLYFMGQGDIMDACDDELMRGTIGDDFQISFFPENSNSSSTPLEIPRCNSTTSLCVSSTESHPPPLHLNTASVKYRTKKNKTKSSKNLDQSSNPIILDFGNKISQPVKTLASPNGVGTNVDEVVVSTKRIRPPSQTYDHIMAERRRREQLSQRFIALSSIVPGLKKMDKASVLGDAIKYLTHMQEKVKTLEEKNGKQSKESVVLVRKTLSSDDEGSSDECNTDYMNDDDQDNAHLPEIEARILDKSIHIRIHCEKRKGVMVNILSEIEKLNLTIVNTTSAPFGTLALDVTIITQMEEDFNMTMENFVRTLRSQVC